MVRDASLFRVALVQEKAVSKSYALAGGNFEIAGRFIGQFFKIMLAEGIGGEQPIIAHMPPRRMARVFRVIENSDAHSLAFDRAVVVAPFSTLDRKSTRLNSSHIPLSRMPSSACK